jgi:6-phosphogluconolactonase
MQAGISEQTTHNVGNVHTFSDHSQWVEYIATRWFEDIIKQLEEGHAYVAAVAGGATPFPVYARLRDLLMKISGALSARITIVPIDDRLVPLNDPASNAGRLMSIFECAGVNVIKPKTELEPEKAGIDLEKRILEHFVKNKRPVWFDHIILGVGIDGHIASIFPEMMKMPAIHSGGILHAGRYLGHQRITFTLPWLKLSRARWVLAVGKEKKALLQSLSTGLQTQLPIAHLLQDGGAPLEWFMV